MEAASSFGSIGMESYLLCDFKTALEYPNS